MVCSYRKLVGYVAQAAALTAFVAGSVCALTILSPTPGQIVRETVKITIPADAVPTTGAPGFISVLVEENGAEKFVAAYGRASAHEAGNKLTFYWSSKAPYYDSNAPMKQNYFKDGPHKMKVQVHNADGKAIDSATVDINIQNKVPRPNPAPAVTLVNKLGFGQMNTYRIRSDVQVFEVVAKVGLPILGGLGIQGDYTVVQSVEDVRPDGSLLMRYRIGDKPYISSQGVKTILYEDQQIKPQLYRLVTKYGKVINPNMFSKQAQYSIMDVLPMLPAKAVKEGDSWPDKINVKVEGLTQLVALEGTSQLDSFEWENGRKCAKIVSQLTGDTKIVLLNGQIRSTGPITARVTTWHAYDTGKMLRRDIDLEFPAIIAPGTGDMSAGSVSSGVPSMLQPLQALTNYYKNLPFDEDDDIPAGPSVTPRTEERTPDTTTKKGTVRINVVVRLEK